MALDEYGSAYGKQRAVDRCLFATERQTTLDGLFGLLEIADVEMILREQIEIEQPIERRIAMLGKRVCLEVHIASLAHDHQDELKDVLPAI